MINTHEKKIEPADYHQKVVNLVFDGLIAARDGDLDTAEFIANQIDNLVQELVVMAEAFQCNS